MTESIKPGGGGDAVLPADERLSKAVEFAEYMAKGAEQLMAALNDEDKVRLRREESDDVHDDTMYDAESVRMEHMRGLRADIYEFRKRAAREAARADQQKSIEDSAERCSESVRRAAVARPMFITFTGADEHTSLEGMKALSQQYPIEWGILFSPKRQGEGRYPPLSMLGRLRKVDGVRLSAHLCGGHSRDVIERGASELDGFIADLFERAQINSAADNIDIMRVNRWAFALSVNPILQCRGDSFPAPQQVAWLYDKSGGKGIVPTRWPRPHPTMTSGYAGGIRPENVLDVIAAIDATDYWIDMESGVRDERDRFSLDKCRQVCEAVYGARRPTERKTSHGDSHAE